MSGWKVATMTAICILLIVINTTLVAAFTPAPGVDLFNLIDTTLELEALWSPPSAFDLLPSHTDNSPWFLLSKTIDPEINVDLFTGAINLTYHDLHCALQEPPLLTRSYVNNRWHLSFDALITINDTKAHVIDHEGRHHQFDLLPYVGLDGYTPPTLRSTSEHAQLLISTGWARVYFNDNTELLFANPYAQHPGAGRLRRIKAAPGQSVYVSRNEHGIPVEIYRPNDHRYEIDIACDQIAIKRDHSSVCTYYFNSRRQLVLAKTPTDAYRYHYNDNQKLSSIITDDSHIDYSYDQQNRVTTVTSDAKTHTIRYGRNGYRSITSNSTTRYYRYDEGRLSATYLPDGTWVRYEYHGNGHSIHHYATAGVNEYRFADHGNLIHFVDYTGAVTRWSYDPDTLLPVERINGDNTYIRYAYTTTGQLAGIETNDHQQRWEYDDYGRPVTIWSAADGSTHIGYVSQFTVGRLLSPDTVSNYYYDRFHRLQTVSCGNACYSIEYDGDDPSRIIWADGQILDLNWQDQQLLSWHHSDGLTYEEHRGDTGQLEAISIGDDTWTISYHDRQVSGLNAPGEQRWTFSRNETGRINTISNGTDTLSVVWDETYDRISSLRDARNRWWSYEYNGYGQIASIRRNGHLVAHYEYDHNRLVTARTPSGTFGYEYDGDKVTITLPDRTQQQIAVDKRANQLTFTTSEMEVAVAYNHIGQITDMSVTGNRQQIELTDVYAIVDWSEIVAGRGYFVSHNLMPGADLNTLAQFGSVPTIDALSEVIEVTGTIAHLASAAVAPALHTHYSHLLAVAESAFAGAELESPTNSYSLAGYKTALTQS